MVNCSVTPEVQWEELHMNHWWFVCVQKVNCFQDLGYAAVGELYRVCVGWSCHKAEGSAVFRCFQKRLWGLLSLEERVPLYSEGYCHFSWLSQFLFLRPHRWSTFRELGRLSVMVLDSRILSLMAQTVFHLLLSSSSVINAGRLMMAKYQILPKLVILFVFSCPTSSAQW